MRTDGQIKNKNIYFLDRHENVTGVVSTESTDETAVPLLSAKTNEELGSYDVIELEILASHKDSIQIPEDGSIVYHDEFMGWREYHITKLVDSDKDNAVTKEITGELSSIELLDAKFENSDYLEGTVGDMATKLLEGTRFTLGRFDFGIRSINLGHKGTAELKHKSVLECLYFIAGKADCDMYFSYKVDGNKVYSREVNFIKKLGDDNGKRFEVGKDVNSVTREIDYSNVKTAIIPTGDFEEGQKEVSESSEVIEDGNTGISDVKKELTIENVVWKKPDNPTDKPKGQKFLADLDSLARWGRKDSKGQLIHSFVHVHFSIKDDKELAKMAWVELGKYKNPKITYELDVMDLYNLTGQSEHKHENVVLGDVVSVIDRYFPKPMAVKSRVMKIERDLIDPTNNKVTLGDLYQTYTSQAISNESMIAGKLDDLVDKTDKVVTAIVTDRQTNNYGSTQPVSPKKGDLWFRPHPQKPEENQMLIWDGVQWVVQLDTSVNTEAFEKTKNIEKDLEQSKQEILEVREQAEKGIEKANQTIKDINSETQKELARVQAEADKALQAGSELLNNVESLKETVNKQGLDIQKNNDSLKVKVDKTDIDELKQTVSKQGTELSLAKNSINLKADKTTVDSIKQSVDKQGTELAVTKDAINLKADKSQVNAIDKTVKQQGSELTVQSDMIKAQASKVDGNSSQIANLKVENNKISSTVTQVSDSIKKIDLDSRNYILGSDITLERENIVKNNTLSISTKGVISNLLDGIQFYRGKEFTVSCDIEYKNGKNRVVDNVQNPKMSRVGFEISIYFEDGSINYFSAWKFLSKEGENFKGRVVNTVYIANKPIKSISMGGIYIQMSADYAKVQKPKMILGNHKEKEKMNIWSPAPEDLATQQELSTVVQTVDSLTTVVQGKAEKSQIVQLSNQITSVIQDNNNNKTGIVQLNNQVSMFANSLYGGNFLYNSDFKEFDSSVEEHKSITGWTSSMIKHGGSIVRQTDSYNMIGSSYSLLFTLGTNGFSSFNSRRYDIPEGASVLSASIKHKAYRAIGLQNITLQIRFFNADEKYLSTKDTKVESFSGSTWQTSKLENIEVPIGAKKFIFDIYVNGETNGAVYICQPQIKLGSAIGEYTAQVPNVSSRIDILQDNIQSTVQKGDVISTINQSPEKITLDAKRIHITGETTIDNAAIRSAAIRDLSADKINTGTLNAKNVRVINLDASSITTGTLNATHIGANSITARHLSSDAIQVGLNNFGRNIKISPDYLSFYKSGVLTSKITEDGQEYWSGSRLIGSVGESHLENNTSVKGVVNRLASGGDYISWSYQENAGNLGYTPMLILDPKGKFTGRMGIHVRQKMWVEDIGTSGGILKIGGSSIEGGSPMITSYSGKSGVIFGGNNFYVMDKGKMYNIENLLKLMTELGKGSFSIPKSFNSNGTASSWVNITI